MAFKLPELGYAFDALEPHIDARTMEIHYSKHHAGYTNNLNNAIQGSPLENQSIEEILKHLDMSNNAVRNNGGGFYNHGLFWESIHPEDRGRLSGPLKMLLKQNMVLKMTLSRSSLMLLRQDLVLVGLGYVCILTVLWMCSTANQDNPLMPGIGCGGKPIWDLMYGNMLTTFIIKTDVQIILLLFWNVVNWNEVERKYANS